MLTVKFLYGTRVITIFYLAKKKISYGKFLYYDSFSTIAWIFGIGAVGYFVGLGVAWVLKVVKGIQWAVTLLIAALALFYLIQKFISKELIQKEKKLEKFK